MSQTTSIEWTDVSWNPVHGCSKVSPGCAHCYAETLSRRYKQTPAAWTPANAEQNVILKPHKIHEPLKWKEPRMVFVNSMSDLFHELVPDSYIGEIFTVMAQAKQHTFQVLTKRPERMRDLLTRARDDLGFGPIPNVWLGVSIENRRFVHRADLLRDTPAAVRFISAEPLLGPLTPTCETCEGHGWVTQETVGIGMGCCGEFTRWGECCGNAIPVPEPQLEQAECPDCYRGVRGVELTAGIDWCIAGGESGPRHRRLDLQWVRDLRDSCVLTDTAFFVKQLGGARPGTKLEDLPEDLRIREFPVAA